MTQQAADAVERIVSRPELPETAVLRIVAAARRGSRAGPTRELQIEVIAAPFARDLVVQEMRISVEPRSLAFLDDKVLDAQLADGGEVEFKLYPQTGIAGMIAATAGAGTNGGVLAP